MTESYSNGYYSTRYAMHTRKESDSVSNGYRSLYYSHSNRNSGNATLTPLDVKNIRKYKDEMTRKELADFYDVSVTTIREVIEHLRWVEIN